MQFDPLTLLTAAIEVTRYLFQIFGTGLSALGALIVRYPDMPDGRLKTFIERFIPRSKTLTEARDQFHDNGRITDQDRVAVVKDVFEQRYHEIDVDNEPEQVTETSTTIRIDYPQNRISNPFRDREPGQMEKQLFFDWGLRRLTTQKGMWYIATGFILLLIGTLLNFPLL